ncbi:hypothetical protein AB0L75_24985 [Streptomyces sp. NPDC052101]|uniref:hypothetical protein n=1 Tax=Streptomyces sp. NPDC052101 TaxID=3155763 RepID=UPI00343A3D1C
MVLVPVEMDPKFVNLTLNVSMDCVIGTDCTSNNSDQKWSGSLTWTPGDIHVATGLMSHTYTSTNVDVRSVWLTSKITSYSPVTNPSAQRWIAKDAEIRCDTVVTKAGGCVFPKYKPTWVMNFKKFPAAVAHAWLTQAKLPNHPGSALTNKPLIYLPATGSTTGRTPEQNRKIICPKGWAAKNGNPDATTLPGNTPSGKDPFSCDEFAYAATYNSGGMPAPDGLNPVASGDQCLQTYSQRTQPDVWHFYDEIRQGAPTWKEVCGRSAMSNWMNTQSMQPFPSSFSQPNRLLEKDEYWYYAPEFDKCDASKATVKCTLK